MRPVEPLLITIPIMTDRLKYSLGFAALGLLLFVPFLGGVALFDWDEINFAEISREMLLTGDYWRIYVNFEPFWEKPPLFFWLQALAMQAGGVGAFAARLPNALCGILTLVLLYQLGERLYHHRFGVLWAGTYLGTVLPFLYFKSGIIDPWFNLFIFLGLYLFILGYWRDQPWNVRPLKRPSWVYLAAGGACIGLGILTKGPVAYLLVVLTLGVYWIYQRLRWYVSIGQLVLFSGVALLVAGAWYGSFFIDQFAAFTAYQYRLLSTPDAGHGGFPGYHFVVVLLGCFPASILALRAFGHLPAAEPQQEDFRRWMKYLFWVVLILFSLVKSKIVHYSSLSYFPLSFLAALVADHLIAGRLNLTRWLKGGIWALGSIYLLVVTALPLLGQRIDLLRPLLARDPFAQANLAAQVNWTEAYLYLPTFCLLGLLVAFSWLSARGRLAAAFGALYGGMAVFVLLTLIAFVGRIERYSQHAAVEFFASKAGEDCYLGTHGYKSYVHLFYGAPPQAGRACFIDQDCMERLLRQPLDRPAYIVTKIHRVGELAGIPGLEEIGRKNGFVFFRRGPAK